MKFFIFSYNRGPFLRNCIESIERCAPGAELVVFDDDSDDPETRQVLADVARRHEVVSAAGSDGHKHGGLYANMQAALESLREDELICFTQDDTQLVRRLDAEDDRFLWQRFQQDEQLGFISPAFVREIALQRRGAGRLEYAPEHALYFWRGNTRSAGVWYSDLFISTAERLRSRGWKFASGEPANQARAKALFSEMGYLKAPFLMWLPNGTAYRGKKKTLALRLAEQKRKCGFYPLSYMTDEEVLRLRASPASELPIAEDFLKPTHGNLGRPWIYNPLQGSRALKHLNRVELLLGSLMKK